MITRVNLNVAMRGAAVTLLETYKAAAGVKLQVYRARPSTLYPPTAFVDRMTEQDTIVGPTMRQQLIGIEVVVVHGLFDSGEAVDQRDAFVDGFGNYLVEQFHAAGGQTLISTATFDDDPNYVPDWIEDQKAYYATRITLEGFANN